MYKVGKKENKIGNSGQSMPLRVARPFRTAVGRFDASTGISNKLQIDRIKN